MLHIKYDKNSKFRQVYAQYTHFLEKFPQLF